MPCAGSTLPFGQGEFAAILGASGSGKTTLLNLAGAIDDPTEGKVIINGQDISLLSDNQKAELRNRTIGYIFQNFNLVPVLSALENVMLSLQIRGGRMSAIPGSGRRSVWRRWAWRTSCATGRTSCREASVSAWPSRARWSRGRCSSWPTSPRRTWTIETAQSIIDLMKDLNEKEKVTFIFSTHDQRLIDRVRRVVRIDDGKIVQ